LIIIRSPCHGSSRHGFCVFRGDAVAPSDLRPGLSLSPLAEPPTPIPPVHPPVTLPAAMVAAPAYAQQPAKLTLMAGHKPGRFSRLLGCIVLSTIGSWLSCSSPASPSPAAEDWAAQGCSLAHSAGAGLWGWAGGDQRGRCGSCSCCLCGMTHCWRRGFLQTGLPASAAANGLSAGLVGTLLLLLLLWGGGKPQSPMLDRPVNKEQSTRRLAACRPCKLGTLHQPMPDMSGPTLSADGRHGLRGGCSSVQGRMCGALLPAWLFGTTSEGKYQAPPPAFSFPSSMWLQPAQPGAPATAALRLMLLLGPRTALVVLDSSSELNRSNSLPAAGETARHTSAHTKRSTGSSSSLANGHALYNS
jgi:hypothetical protein